MLLKSKVGLISAAIVAAVAVVWGMTSRVLAHEPRATAKPLDYSANFSRATDYWEFAHRILSAAKAGDASAQYYLWRVLNRCAADNKMYFNRRGQVLSLDLGLQWAEKRNLSVDVARSVYERCHEFLLKDAAELGSANDWLAQATAAGQPQAQASTALQHLTEQTLQNFRQTAVASVEASDVTEGSVYGQSPRTLLRQAVESKNPDVLFAIGEAQGFLVAPGSDAKISQLAWWLVACERGLDCSSDSDWVKIACMSNTQCASITDSSQFVRILADQDWSSVAEFAGQINAKLDAGQWDDLGLGS